MAVIADDLNFIAWSKTKDAVNNINRPECIVDKLTNRDTQQDCVGFASGKEFLQAWNKKDW